MLNKTKHAKLINVRTTKTFFAMELTKYPDRYPILRRSHSVSNNAK
jgi:hypothetical protein